MSGNLTSSPQQLTNMALASIQASWTGGTALGTLILQISNATALQIQQNDSSIVWTDYTGSSAAVSGAGNFMWNLAAPGFPYVRVKFTRTSGTGVLKVTANGKGA